MCNELDNLGIDHSLADVRHVLDLNAGVLNF